MKRYTMAEDWGGGEVEELLDHGHSLPPGYVAVVRPGGGRGIIVHKWVLTEIQPPIPAEPGPGAYLIGDGLARRLSLSPHDTERWAVVGASHWLDWPSVWALIAHQPDGPIVPLIPDPAHGVTLPWNGDDRGVWPRIFVSDGTVQAGLGSGSGLFRLDAKTAEAMAAALLAAAREAS